MTIESKSNKTHSSTDGKPEQKLAHEARSAMDRIEDAAPQVRERIEDFVDSGRQHVQDFRHEMQDDIRSKPVRSLFIAAGVGAVIGLLIGRRR